MKHFIALALTQRSEFCNIVGGSHFAGIRTGARLVITARHSPTTITNL